MSRFKVCDLKRAIAAVMACDLPVAGAEIRADGSILILTEAPKGALIPPDPLDAWERKHGKSA